MRRFRAAFHRKFHGVSRCSLLNFRVQLLLKIADFTQHTAATASIKKACLLYTSNPTYGYNYRVASTVTAEALVRQVYLQRMTWFFELDAVHLQAINPNLGQDMIVSLMLSLIHI